MRFLQSALLLFFSICLASPALFAAENETDLPPAAPSGEGPTVVRAIFSNGSAMQNSALVLLVRSGKYETIYRLMTDQRGQLLISLGAGQHEIDGLLDYPQTPGIDFASTASVRLESAANITLIFYPSGSLSGKVLSQGSPVPGARVKVSCPSNSFDYERINGASEVKSGEGGDFLFRALPAGACVVSASTDSLANSEEVQIAPGGATSSQIELHPKAGGIDLLLLLAALALAAVAVYLAGKSAQFRSKPAESPAGSLPAEPRKTAAKNAGSGKLAREGAGASASSLSDTKIKAVLSTLSPREADIVRFLIKSGGRAKRSKIQLQLLIPKTSLLRNLRSLERKNIVKLSPFGRNLLAEINEALFK